MPLLLDIGNSRLKWKAAGGQSQQALPLAGLDLTDWLQQHAAVDAIWVVSVGESAALATLQAYCQQAQLPLYQAQTQVQQYGLHNGYTQPQLLGVDRWLAMLAVWRQQPQQAFCVISCGSAITLDVVNAQGQHQGGLITPGLQMQQQSLLQSTADIAAHVAQSPAESQGALLGLNTRAAVTLGCQSAVVGYLTQMLQQVFQHYGECPLWLTGGDAPWLQPLLSYPSCVQEDLVLQGLQDYFA